MMICPECGTKNLVGSKFCASCGVRLQGAKAGDSEAKDYGNWIDTIRAMTGLSQADFDTLKAVAPVASAWGDEVVQAFYDTLFDHQRTRAVFHEGERPARERTLANWYLSLFEADDNDAFWNAQIRIALAHIRRDVNNEFMVGITTRVREVFHANAMATFGLERGSEVFSAFDRVTNAVVGIVTEGYDVLAGVAIDRIAAVDKNMNMVDWLIKYLKGKADMGL